MVGEEPATHLSFLTIDYVVWSPRMQIAGRCRRFTGNIDISRSAADRGGGPGSNPISIEKLAAKASDESIMVSATSDPHWNCRLNRHVPKLKRIPPKAAMAIA